MQETKQRIEFIDLAKGVCILMVVLMHIVPEFDESFKFLGCLRMPLYFCLSGLFYKDYGSSINFTIKKLNRILIPFIVWYLVGYTSLFLGRMATGSQTESIFHFSDVLFTNQIYNLPVWFLLCLFWSNMFFNIIHRIARKWYYEIAGVLILASFGWIMSIKGIFNFLYIGSSMTCLPFFYLGYVLKNTGLLYKTANRKKDIILMGICIILAFIFIFVPDYPPLLRYYKNEIVNGNPFTIYLASTFFVIGVLLICKFIGKLPLISWLGRYSIIVLVTHCIVGAYVGTAIDILSGEKVIGFIREITVFSLTLALMLIIIPFCKKYLPYITAQKDILPLQVSRKMKMETSNQ